MEKKEEIAKAEKEIKDSEEEVKQAKIALATAQLNLENAKKILDWASKSPLEKNKQRGIIALESAMAKDKKIGKDGYMQVLNALKEEPPESKMALVLDELLRSVTSEGKE